MIAHVAHLFSVLVVFALGIALFPSSIRLFAHGSLAAHYISGQTIPFSAICRKLMCPPDLFWRAFVREELFFEKTVNGIA